jgi:hypothetical protein
MAGGVRKQWRAKDSPPFFELAYFRSDVAPFDLNKDNCWIGIKGKCPYRGDSLGAASRRATRACATRSHGHFGSGASLR